MMKPKYFIVLLIVPFMAQGAEWPQRIEVYVNGPTAISGIHTARSKGVQVDVLDVAPAESFEHQLNRNLPKNQAKATYVARNRINRLTSERKAGALLAITVRESARRLGIARLSFGRHRWADDHSLRNPTYVEQCVRWARF